MAPVCLPPAPHLAVYPSKQLPSPAPPRPAKPKASLRLEAPRGRAAQGGKRCIAPIRAHTGEEWGLPIILGKGAGEQASKQPRLVVVPRALAAKKESSLWLASKSTSQPDCHGQCCFLLRHSAWYLYCFASHTQQQHLEGEGVRHR